MPRRSSTHRAPWPRDDPAAKQPVAKPPIGLAVQRAGARAPGTTPRRSPARPIETRVLTGLHERMLTPKIAAEFIRSFDAECIRARKESAGRSPQAATRLTEVERRIAGIVESIENGAWNRTLGLRLEELEREQVTLQAEVAAAASPEPVVRLHPNAADIYRDKVAVLEASLAKPDIRQEAADALRALIERVILTPDA